MYDTEEARRINDYLNKQEHNWQGKPVFRLVWSDDQFEYREGTYNEFKGELYVRTVHGVKKTPKYPHLKGYWILEMWHEPARVKTEEIKDHNGYEALYVFRAKFKPLPLRLLVVELILKAKRTPLSSMLRKSVIHQEMEDKEKRLDQYTFDAIDPSTPMQSCLHFKEGVSYSGLDIPDAKKREPQTNPASKSGQ